ncbi:MAG: hypothetical protein K2X47_08270 [Bdellovibrionales bacterium]|nr:hypothetical protein [Bdellovibrionales bacterium]
MKAFSVGFLVLCCGLQAQAMMKVVCQRSDFAQTKVSYSPEGSQVRVKIQSNFTNLISGVKLPKYPGIENGHIGDLVEIEFLIPETGCQIYGKVPTPLIRCQDHHPQGTLQIRTRVVQSGTGVALTADEMTTAHHYEVKINRIAQESLEHDGKAHKGTYAKLFIYGYGAEGEISNRENDPMHWSYTCQ